MPVTHGVVSGSDVQSNPMVVVDVLVLVVVLVDVTAEHVPLKQAVLAPLPRLHAEPSGRGVPEKQNAFTQTPAVRQLPEKQRVCIG